MSQIKFSVRLFDVTSLAADGSQIPRRSCEEYLASANYAESIRTKTAIGGLTHKDRRLNQDLKGLVGMDDKVLIEDNALFYITRLYFKDNDNFLYADAETFDPDYFAGKRKENIVNVQGQLLSGVRMNISVVIQALWSKRGVAEKIIKIKGFDFTMNPSFKGAGMVGDIKVFSEVIEDSTFKLSDELTRQFSESLTSGELTAQTRTYSSDGEISIIKDDSIIKTPEDLFGKVLPSTNSQATVSYSDIVRCYGQGSIQVKIVSEFQGKPITVDKLKELTKDYDDQTPTRSEELRYWLNMLKDITHEGDPKVLQSIYRSNRDKLINILNSVPASDPNRDQLVKARLDQFFRTTPNDTYSTISSISDRVRNQEQPRYTKINRILQSYKNLWNSKKFSEDQTLSLKLLFLQDINLLIKEVLPKILAGQTLNSLYGLNRYGNDIKNSALQLSSTYRRLLIAEKMMKFIPKALYGEWLIDIRSFYQALLVYVFGEGLTEFQLGLIELSK